MRWQIFLSALATISQTAPSFEVESLGFLTGSWLHESGRVQVEEHWTAVRGGSLFGISRTIVDGETVAFEFLRIVRRQGRIFYVAQPNGRTGTDFELTKIHEGTAVFENPQHDHPKIIRYRNNADGTLVAQIEGDEGGQPTAQEFHFRPVARP